MVPTSWLTLCRPVSLTHRATAMRAPLGSTTLLLLPRRLAAAASPAALHCAGRPASAPAGPCFTRVAVPALVAAVTLAMAVAAATTATTSTVTVGQGQPCETTRRGLLAPLRLPTRHGPFRFQVSLPCHPLLPLRSPGRLQPPAVPVRARLPPSLGPRTAGAPAAQVARPCHCSLLHRRRRPRRRTVATTLASPVRPA